MILLPIAGGGNPRPGGQCKTWHSCEVEDLSEFRATEGSTEKFPPWCLELRPRCGPLQPKRRGSGVTESSGARVMFDGVVSSGSPADIAHVPRKDAQIYFHSKTMMYCFV